MTSSNDDDEWIVLNDRNEDENIRDDKNENNLFGDEKILYQKW
jgi:hypothetical protein